MKKLVLVLLCLVLLPFLTKAQQGTVKVMGALYPQVSFLFNNDDSDAGPELDYSTTFRFGGGVGAYYGLSDYFDIGLEFLISPEGQKYTGAYTDNNNVSHSLEAYTKLTYLKVPIALFLHNELDGVSFNFLVGPQFNFLIGGKETFSHYVNDKLVHEYTADATTYTSTTYDLTTNLSTTTEGTFTETPYSKFLFGAFFGLGMSFPLADNLFLSALFRFDYAFGDAENKNAKLEFKDPLSGTTLQKEVWAKKPKFDIKGTTPTGFKAADRPKTSAVTGSFNVRVAYIIGQ